MSLIPAILSMLLGAFLLTAPTQGAESGRPNIVLIYADDLGYGDLSVYNPASKIPTPNLDRLAARGIRFTDAHAPDTICSPSRYGILTGRYSWRTELKSGNWPAERQPWIEPDRLTLATMLRDLGYDTAALGKWGLGADWNAAAKPGRKGLDQSADGIDYTKTIPAGRTIGFSYDFIHLWYGYDLFTKHYGSFRDGGRWYFENGVAEGRALQFEAFDMEEAQLRFARRGVEYIDAKGGRVSNPAFNQREGAPFLLYYAPHIPHLPLVAAEQFRGKTEAGDYGDFVHELDWAVGQIVEALERNGFSDNTLIFFTSDNGPEVHAYERIREHAHASMGRWRGVKRDLWEGGHRVPFLAAWPGRIQPGRVSDALIGQTDIVATVAEALGVELPNDAAEDSISFLHVLEDRSPRDAVRESIIHHSADNKLAVRQGSWVLMVDGDGSGNRRPEPGWFRAARGIEPHQAPRELFNLAADPGQTTNLYGGNPGKARELEALLRRQMQSGRSAPLRRR